MQKTPKRWLLCLAAIVLVSLAFLVYNYPVSSHVSRVVSGMTILIDPGHGGKDQGARGRSGAEEEPIVLAIAQQLRRLLQSEGATVVLTRETDTDLAGSGEGPRKPRDMRQRIGLAHEWKADLIVSLHCNAVPSGYWSGAQVFYNGDKFPSSRLLAETVQAELTRLVGGTNRKASNKLDHYILREAPVPAITVEVGFLSNPREEKLLMDPGYQRSLAWAIFIGVMRFVGEQELGQ